jgi:hypothetical protein
LEGLCTNEVAKFMTETWLQQNDPEGVVFKCKRGPLQSTGTAAQYGVPLATE